MPTVKLRNFIRQANKQAEQSAAITTTNNHSGMKREHDVHTTKVAFSPQGIPVQKETEKRIQKWKREEAKGTRHLSAFYDMYCTKQTHCA